MTQATRRQFWMEQVRDFRASGQARSAFCRRRGYSPESLRLWEKRLSGPSAAGPRTPRRSSFAAVAIRSTGTTAVPPEASSIRLRLPMNVEIDASQLPSAEWMAEVLLRLRQGVAP